MRENQEPDVAIDGHDASDLVPGPISSTAGSRLQHAYPPSRKQKGVP